MMNLQWLYMYAYAPFRRLSAVVDLAAAVKTWLQPGVARGFIARQVYY